VKLALRVLLSLAVAGLLLFVLARWGGAGVADVRQALARLTWSCYLSALGLHLVLYALRAWRFHVLLGDEARGGFVGEVGVTLSYGLASIVLPAKVGELSYVLYSGRALGVRGETALAVLVVARVLDLATLALGMGIACLLVSGPGWLVSAGIAALALGALLLGAAWHGEWFVRAGVWASRVARLDRWRAGARAIARLEGLGSALQAAARGRRLGGAVLLSLAAWTCVFLFCAVLARGLGIEQSSFAEVVFGSGLAILASLVPLSAFASVGTLEAGWVIGFGVFGVSRELALATGAGLHVVQLVNVAGLGLLGHVLMAVATARTVDRRADS
jgi:glycosyltransferase 2 family protein